MTETSHTAEMKLGWRAYIGSWLAAYNPMWFGGPVGRYFMAREIVRITAGLSDLERNIAVRKALVDTLATIQSDVRSKAHE